MVTVCAAKATRSMVLMMVTGIRALIRIQILITVLIRLIILRELCKDSVKTTVVIVIL